MAAAALLLAPNLARARVQVLLVPFRSRVDNRLEMLVLLVLLVVYLASLLSGLASRGCDAGDSSSSDVAGGVSLCLVMAMTVYALSFVVMKGRKRWRQWSVRGGGGSGDTAGQLEDGAEAGAVGLTQPSASYAEMPLLRAEHFGSACDRDGSSGSRRGNWEQS
jgi:hypothetical protein